MRCSADAGLAEGALSSLLVTSHSPGLHQQRNQRVLGHLELVEQVARHYAARCRERSDDLQQVAALGLIRAAERYDSGTNVPFAAFARPHVRGAVLHYLRDVAPLMRVSRRLQERSRQVERCRQQAGGHGAELDLQRQMGLSDRQWRALELIAREACVQVLPPGQLEESQQQLEESSQNGLDAPSESGSEALAALGRLSRRQRDVVERVVLQGQSLRTVALRQGSSAATVHRILHQALAELRRQLSPASAAPMC